MNIINQHTTRQSCIHTNVWIDSGVEV